MLLINLPRVFIYCVKFYFVIFLTATILGLDEGQSRILSIANDLLCLLSIIGYLVEFLQLVNRGRRYFWDFDNYLQLALYTLTIIFIHNLDNERWCSTRLQWQIGAFAVFLSWLNFIFVLKYMPYTEIRINMFCVAFLRLIFLPILLILAFGIPFYMVFVKVSSPCSLL